MILMSAQTLQKVSDPATFYKGKQNKKERKPFLSYFSSLQNLMKTFFWINKCTWEYEGNVGRGGKNKTQTHTTTYKQLCAHVLFSNGVFLCAYIMKQPNCSFGDIKNPRPSKDLYMFQAAVYHYPPAAFVNCSNMCGLESKPNSVPAPSCCRLLNRMVLHAGLCRLLQTKYTAPANPGMSAYGGNWFSGSFWTLKNLS